MEHAQPYRQGRRIGNGNGNRLAGRHSSSRLPGFRPGLDGQLAGTRQVQFIEQRHQRTSGAVQLPVAGEDAAVLVAVAVAEHHVLQRTRALHQGSDAGQRIEGTHDRRGIAQVVDGLEQRHHDQVADGIAGCVADTIQGAAQQADFFLQQQRFQQVAYRFGVADDVVTNRGSAEARTRGTGSGKDRQFALRQWRVRDVGHAQRARLVEQP